jgi:RNA polymerase sigma-70 factor (ECF subfamily)
MATVSNERARQFAAVYEAAYPAVYAYAARRVGSDAADEVAAETFLVAWRKFESIPSDPLPWLYGVARNMVLRHQSSQAREQQLQHALRREREPVALDRENWEDSVLWDAWRQLRAGDREVLALVAWEELGVGDSARVLGCSASVFSVRLYRARRRFDRLLETSRGASSPTELSEA